MFIKYFFKIVPLIIFVVIIWYFSIFKIIKPKQFLLSITNKGLKAILWIHAIIEPNVSGFVSDFALDMG